MNSPLTQLRRLAQWFKRHLFSLFQNTLIFFLVLLLATFVAVMVWECAEKCMLELFGLSSKSGVLKFIGIGMGGILIALQALMSYKRAKAMEDTAKAQADTAKAQADTAKTQADAVLNTEQGLRQERLKNAIEHLGHEKDSVRLGGAYELFHLAEDTPKLRQTVLDILCAHIRQTTGESAYRKTHPSKPSEEVQSLLTLLFVQEHDVFKGCRINLQGSWLNGVDLTEARLEKAVLTEAHLQKANLLEANLQEAHLWDANLQGAYLVGGVNLQEARLWRANLQGVSLGGANLQGANMWETNLQRADLGRAQMQRTYLWRANLQGAYLNGAQLQGADLSKAQLQGADLVGAQLQGTTLDGTQLQGVNSKGQSGETFADRIRKSINQKKDLSGAIFEGGLSREEVDAIVKGLPDTEKKVLRGILEPHIGRPPSNKLPEDSGAITGTYTEEEAEKWIAEYKKAMSEVPTSNTNTGDGQ